MKKLLYLATAIGLVLIATSCAKEQQEKNVHVELAAERSKLTFIHEVLIKDSTTQVNIPIDSTTAILHANGDTTFPLWYRKQLAAAIPSYARAVGDINDQGLILQENDNFNAPAKIGDGAGFDFSYKVPHAYKRVSIMLYQNGEPAWYSGTYEGPATGEYSYTHSYRSLVRAAYYTDVEASTYDANGNPVAFINRRHFYIYGWQTLQGLGDGYGADMKVANLDADQRPDFVCMISNRYSNNINGIRYKVFMNVNQNGTATSVTIPVTKDLYPGFASPYAPTGGSVAVADINGNSQADFIFATYSTIAGANDYDFRYIIAYDINSVGQPTGGWSDVYVVTGINNRTEPNRVRDIGINVVDVDGDNQKDIVLSATWHTGNGTVQNLYRVGKSVGINGAATWDNSMNAIRPAGSFPVSGVTSVNGGGTLIGRYTDKPGGGPLVLMTNMYANNGTPSFANMPIYLDGNTGHISTQPPAQNLTYPSVGNDCRGGGIEIADVDKNGTLDLINMAYISGEFRFYINYDMKMHYYNTSNGYDIFGLPYFTRGMQTGRTN
jgi:hypothetical protein